jgi:hypothetical protein
MSLIYVICVWLRIVMSNTYSVVLFVLFVVVLCLVYDRHLRYGYFEMVNQMVMTTK